MPLCVGVLFLNKTKVPTLDMIYKAVKAFKSSDVHHLNLFDVEIQPEDDDLIWT